MKKSTVLLFVLGVAALLAVGAWANNAADVPMVSFGGKVVDDAGKPVRGATVSLYSQDKLRSVSVYSQGDGTFRLPEQPRADYHLRARLIGKLDTWQDVPSTTDAKTPVQLAMKPAAGWDLQLQRTGVDLISFLKFDNEADALNFKMMCTYCHQVGTLGFRSPEEPVDWEVMLTRMDGFQGLSKHLQETLVDRVVKTYRRDAEKNWPAFTAPEPPSGPSLAATVREWAMGRHQEAMIHDLEIGNDGVIYTVDMTADAIETLDPATGERRVFSLPNGKEYGTTDRPIKGPHSIEMEQDGDMWLTLALSGEMAEFDVETKEWKIGSGHEAPRPRAGYPHTLRFAPNGVLWWTDAALGVFSLDPKTWDPQTKRWTVEFHKLPDANQVRGGGARGESQGVTPYGIATAPNGHVWYTKLNGQRVGRVRPELPDGDPGKITEWQPPVHGPRRLEVAPDGLVWVPGWASGDIASFNPETEQWKVYPLPKGPDALPYALSVNPKNGEVWICGTGTDSMVRFDPKTETFVEYNMPTRVTYPREIAFDAQGNPWVTNSNYPPRHIENGYGSVIQVAAR